jgi:acetyl-CoA acetyltransferase
MRRHRACYPFGMTGSRIMTTLLNPPEDRDKTIGLESMCAGGGQGTAMVAGRIRWPRPGPVGLDGRDG